MNTAVYRKTVPSTEISPYPFEETASTPASIIPMIGILLCDFNSSSVAIDIVLQAITNALQLFVIKIPLFFYLISVFLLLSYHRKEYFSYLRNKLYFRLEEVLQSALKHYPPTPESNLPIQHLLSIFIPPFPD